MLERHDSTQISTLLARLVSPVRLPDEWRDYFERDGLLATTANEQRQFPRRHMTGKAILEITGPLPCVSRKQMIHAVYTRDISRTSISFLHVAQMYPGESGRIWLAENRTGIEVVRCRRINSQCYVVGAEMVDLSA